MTRANQSGFSLLELVLVIIMVVALYVVAVDRVLPLRGDAEAASAATIAGTLRSSLGMEVADRIVNRGLASIAELDGANPMRLLAEVPENYLGEVSGVDPVNLPKGNWYFDLEARELVYLVRYGEYFRTELEGPPRLAFRTELVYNDRGEIAGVKLERINEFVWTQSAETAEILGNQ